MRRSLLFVASMALLLSTGLSQECKKTDFGAEEQKYLDDALSRFAACPLPLEASCRATLAQSLERIYGVKDFGDESKYMSPSEIGKRVTADSNWTHLGSASDQTVLKSAQDSANCGKAVIAVLASDTGGHVAMVLPGSLARSESWKLNVPKAASFFTHDPSKSFASKPLSYAFSKTDGIELYARK